MDANDLVEIEAIKQLKARYFRFLDTKDWEGWRSVFTEDFEAEIHGPHEPLSFEGADQMVSSNAEILAEAPTVHHGHTCEIEITGPDSARGIWAMMDIVKLGPGFTGYGHYHEEYRKQGGEWRIARLKLTRTLIEGEGPGL